MSGQVRQIDWQCGHCGCQDANHLTRDGHYRRNLCTSWGSISGLQVPMVQCQRCHHDVICHFAILEKSHRFGMDRDQAVLFASGCGQSLRHVQEQWSATVEANVGLRMLNERINQIEPVVQAAHRAPLRDIPPVLHRDGIWVTIQQSQEAIKPDKRQGQRKKRSGKKSDPGGPRLLAGWQAGDPRLASRRQ
ncbi:MAG TPA: hypothetical protein VGF67_01860 [Ktedonobacteraceae bacterium]|jgi:hypothetical protein